LNLKEATFENNSDFAYGRNKIDLSSHTKNLWTKSQGLSRLYLGEIGVGSSSGDLTNSVSSGRVAFLDAEGIKLKEMKQVQINEIEKRYSKAVKILKGN